MKSQNKKGFTLIELLVVIAIIGIISALVLVAINGLKNKAKKTRVQSNLQDFIKVAVLAQGETGKFLKDITGSPCSDCGWCPPISVGVTCRNRDLRNISEEDGCFKCWKSAITKIQAASGGGIQLNIDKFLRDLWGSPYGLDENERERLSPPNRWGLCMPDIIRSAGPNGILYDSDDIAVAIPLSMPCP